MQDFRAYVREHLPRGGASGAKEVEVIEELALNFEERYKTAVRGRMDPGGLIYGSGSLIRRHFV